MIITFSTQKAFENIATEVETEVGQEALQAVIAHGNARTKKFSLSNVTKRETTASERLSLASIAVPHPVNKTLGTNFLKSVSSRFYSYVFYFRLFELEKLKLNKLFKRAFRIEKDKCTEIARVLLLTNILGIDKAGCLKILYAMKTCTSFDAILDEFDKTNEDVLIQFNVALFAAGMLRICW